MRKALSLAWLLLAVAGVSSAQLAAPLECGIPADSEITPGGPPQLFTFRTTEPNDAVAIRLASTSADPKFGVTATVRDPIGRRLSPRRSSPLGVTGAEFDLAEAGDYTVEVQATSTTLGGTFRIVRVRLKGSCTGVALACGTPAKGQIASGLLVHSYEFPGEAGDSYTVRMVKTTAIKTDDERLASFAVAVYGPAGQLENMTVGGKATPAALTSTTTVKIDLRLPSRGPRTVLVYESSNGTRTGFYSLAMARLNGPCRSKAARCNMVADGVISQPGQIDSYSLPATAGDVFLVKRARPDGSAVRPLVEVYGPDGAYVTPAPSSDLSRYLFTAAAAGAYTVLAADDQRLGGAETGGYAISVARVNRPCDAQPLECGVVSDSRVDGPLRFTAYSVAADAGDAFLLRLMRTDTSGGFKPRAEVYSPAGDLVQMTSTVDQGRAIFKAPAPGAYTVLTADGADGTRTGAYSVALARVNRPCNATALNCGGLATGTLNGPLRFAAYSYAAQAGDAFTARILDPNDTLQESIEVYDPEGNPAGTVFPGNFPAVDVVRAAAGSYTILAMDGGRTPGLGTFAVQVFRTRSGCGAAPPPGGTVAGLVTGQAPFTAWVLPASAGDSLLVRSASFTPNFVAGMELFDPDGARVTTSTYAVSAAAKADGDYTLIVGASSPRTAGKYVLSWQALNRPAQAGPLACGQPAGGSLAPAAQFRYYRTSAAAGDVLRLVLSRISDNFGPQLELYDAGGRRVAAGNTDVTRRIDAAGDYLVLVGPSTATGETGAYALALQRPNRPCFAADVACGQTVLRTVDAAGRMDAFTLAGAAGERTVIRTPARFGLFAPFLELYDAAGTLLQSGAVTQITRTLAGPGNYTLLVRDRAGMNTGTYRVSVQHETDACAQDDSEAPVIRLGRPTGGEALPGGLPFRIVWESDDNVDVASHEIRLSTDDGATFATVLGSVPGPAQAFDWYVPADVQPVRTAKIRVTATDVAGNTASATSDALALIGSGFGENASVTYEYDGLDRLVRTRYADGTVVEYTWDAAGNLLETAVRKP